MPAEQLIGLLQVQAAQNAAQSVQITVLTEQVAALTVQVAELTRKLGRNSKNSSLPPSADRSPGSKDDASSQATPVRGRRGATTRSLVVLDTVGDGEVAEAEGDTAPSACARTVTAAGAVPTGPIGSVASPFAALTVPLCVPSVQVKYVVNGEDVTGTLAYPPVVHPCQLCSSMTGVDGTLLFVVNSHGNELAADVRPSSSVVLAVTKYDLGVVIGMDCGTEATQSFSHVPSVRTPH